jgi:chemotaxis protein MotB
MGKKKKDGPPPEDGGPETPEWIVTFSDMISLLVTFFVLLLTFSSLESDDVLKIRGAMTGTMGSIVADLADSMVMAPNDRVAKTDPIRGVKDPHSRPPEELPDRIAEHGDRPDEDQIEMDLSSIGDGLEIPFSVECSFAPGSAKLPAALAQHASELAEVISHYPYQVLIEGFTDDAFKPTPTYPDPESLALARASAVADVMTGTTDLQLVKVQLAGLGMKKPIASNETALGRRQNRRVTVRLLSLSKAHQDYLQSERQREAADALTEANAGAANPKGD